LRAPAGTSPADNAVLNDLTLDHHLDHRASLCEPRSGDLGATAHARTGPRQRDDRVLIRGIDQGAGDADPVVHRACARWVGAANMVAAS